MKMSEKRKITQNHVNKLPKSVEKNIYEEKLKMELQVQDRLREQIKQLKAENERLRELVKEFAFLYSENITKGKDRTVPYDEWKKRLNEAKKQAEALKGE